MRKLVYYAAVHKSTEVLHHALDLNIIVAFIPAGVTCLLQVCDLIINKPLKQNFKKLCCAWKIQSHPGPGGKYKVPRDNVTRWIEDSFIAYNSRHTLACTISTAYKKYGQDFRDNNSFDFSRYLGDMEVSSIYSSLLENQSAGDFD